MASSVWLKLGHVHKNRIFLTSIGTELSARDNHNGTPCAEARYNVNFVQKNLYSVSTIQFRALFVKYDDVNSPKYQFWLRKIFQININTFLVLFSWFSVIVIK